MTEQCDKKEMKQNPQKMLIAKAKTLIQHVVPSKCLKGLVQ